MIRPALAWLAAIGIAAAVEPLAVDANQPGGMTPLLWAAHRDDHGEVERLLAKGAEPGQANDYGIAPLAIACRNGNPAIVRAMLEAGADPNAARPSGETALMTAARQGDPEVLAALLEAGADPDASDASGQTALMWAAAAGHAEAVERLLAAGADPHVILKSGFDAFFFAVRHGQREVVARLLEAGVDLDRRARPRGHDSRWMETGSSALIVAVENAHYELALDLVAAGADPNDRRSGHAPLHVLTWVRKSVRGDGVDGAPEPQGSGSVSGLEFVRRMVAAGAEVDIEIKRGGGGQGRFHSGGMTPFLMAAQTGDLPLMKLLLELGADPDKKNVTHSTALLAAAGLGVGAPGEEASREPDTLKALEFLLELGADVNVVDNNGETIMHAAAYKGSGKVVRFLAEKGADIEVWNRPNKWGSTPLHIARGYRPGNFRKIDQTIAAFTELMQEAGVEIPPPPKQLDDGERKDWSDR